MESCMSREGVVEVARSRGGVPVLAPWIEFDQCRGQPAPLPATARDVGHRPDVPTHDGSALTQHEHRVMPRGYPGKSGNSGIDI
jgi:hypothetical protein